MKTSRFDHPDEAEARARHQMVKRQARIDPICAELLALEATMHMAGGGQAFITTMVDYEEEDDEFRPF